MSRGRGEERQEEGTERCWLGQRREEEPVSWGEGGRQKEAGREARNGDGGSRLVLLQGSGGGKGGCVASGLNKQTGITVGALSRRQRPNCRAAGTDTRPHPSQQGGTVVGS